MVKKPEPPKEPTIEADKPNLFQRGLGSLQKGLGLVDKVVDTVSPFDNLAKAANEKGDKLRAEGKNGGGFFKFLGGTSEVMHSGVEGATGGNPVGVISSAGHKVIENVNNTIHDEKRVIQGMAKGDHGSEKKLSAEYQRFKDEHFFPPTSKTANTTQLVVDSVVGPDIYVAGGRPIWAFKKMHEAGGSVQELEDLKKIAEKNEGSIDSEDYIGMRSFNKKKDPETAKENMAELKSALKLGGSGHSFLSDLKKGKEKDYLKELEEYKAEKAKSEKSKTKTGKKLSEADVDVEGDQEKALAQASQIREDLAAKGVAQQGADIPNHQTPGAPTVAANQQRDSGERAV